MNNFKSQNYSKSLKKLMPQGKRLRKDGLALVCSIIYEINNDFIDAILQKTKHTSEIRSEDVEESVKPLIPRGLKTKTASAGKTAVLKFLSGEVTYDAPKPYTVGVLEPRMLQKSLEELTKVAHCNLSLSRSCSTISGIIQRLAICLSAIVTEAARNDPEHALEIYINTLKNALGDELSFHVEGHAENNLNWYKIGRLDFSLKSPHSESILEFAKCPIFTKGIQKLARGCFGASLTKYTIVKIEASLMAVLDKVVNCAKEGIEPELIEFTTVKEVNIYRTVKDLFPQNLFRHAGSHAHDNVMKYSFGDLRYEYIRPAKKESTTEVDLQVAPNGRIKLNFQKTIKTMLQGSRISAEKDFFSHMNEMLNDLVHALAEKCSENAQTNDGDLTMHDVFISVDKLLPAGTRRFAKARISSNLFESGYMNRMPIGIRPQENYVQRPIPESMSSSRSDMRQFQSMEIDDAVSGTSKNGIEVGARQNHEQQSMTPAWKENLGNQAVSDVRIDDTVMDTTGPQMLESEVRKTAEQRKVEAMNSVELEISKKTMADTKRRKSEGRDDQVQMIPSNETMEAENAVNEFTIEAADNIEAGPSKHQAKNNNELGIEKGHEQEADTREGQSKFGKDRTLTNSKDDRIEIENIVNRITHETASNIDLQAKKSHEQKVTSSVEQGALESKANKDVMDVGEKIGFVRTIDTLSPAEVTLLLHDIPRVIYWLDIRPYEKL